MAAAAASVMATDPPGARVHMRNVLEEICQKLLRRLVEDDPPREKDGVQDSLDEVRSLLPSWMNTQNLPAYTKKVSEVCGADQLPPPVLEVLARKVKDARWGDDKELRALKSAVLCQEKVDAFFAEEHGLPHTFYRQLRAALGPKHWGRMRLGLNYGVQLGASEGVSGASGRDPEAPLSAERRADPEVLLSAGVKRRADLEVQLSANTKRRADPEVQLSAGADSQTGGRHAPEVRTTPANAALEVEHVDLTLGDNKARVGYYIEVKKTPKSEQTLVQSRKKLRAVLGAERASAPGGFHTSEDSRVCYQVIFYSAEKLALESERPEHVQKLLSRHSHWRQVIDCNDAAWQLPKREMGVCIIEVKPDY